MTLTIMQKVMQIITNKPGLTESEIAREIFGPRGVQQQVNGDCRLLVDRGIVRREGRGGPGAPFRYFME